MPHALGKAHDIYTLHTLAGHTDMNTTKRYTHPNEADIREAMAKVWGGHRTGHSAEKNMAKPSTELLDHRKSGRLEDLLG